jgi:hypothetical protein
MALVETKVSDLHIFNVDADLDPDLEQAFLFTADPDPAPHQDVQICDHLPTDPPAS